jgi:hypothetical protein
MNKFITEDSVINGSFTSLPKAGSNPHPYGLPTVDPTEENRVSNQQVTSSRPPDGRSDTEVSDAQGHPLSQQSPKDDSLNRQKYEQVQNSRQRGFRAVNQPQRRSRSDSKSSKKRSHKKAPPIAAPEVRVTKPNKSRPPRKAPTISKRPTKSTLQAIDSEISTGEQKNSPHSRLFEISNVNMLSEPTSEQPDDPDNPRRFVIGLDFGTTTTAVSYFAHPVDEPSPTAFPDDVKSIMNWPNDDTNGYMYGLMKQGKNIGGSSFPILANFGKS